MMLLRMQKPNLGTTFPRNFGMQNIATLTLIFWNFLNGKTYKNTHFTFLF